MNRFRVWMLCILTAALLAFAAAASAEETTIVASGWCGRGPNTTVNDDLTWTLDSEGLLTVRGEGLMYNGSAMPQWYSYREQIKSIKIEEGVTSVGYYAFDGCINLTIVDLPSSLTMIGNHAFSGCTSLTQIKLPKGIKRIDWYAFENCTNLKQVEMATGITIIGSYAFRNCTSLTQIELPEGVTSIGGSAFSDCTALKQVELPESVTSIGDYAFWGCKSLTQIKLPAGVTSIGSGAFYNCASLAQIDLPIGITSVGEAAFRGCKSLMQIKLPSGITGLEEYLFYGCTNLKAIEIPSGITSIGNGVFEYCYNLKYVIIYAKDGLTNISATFPKTDVTVYCWEYYYAESWARENGCTVKLLDDMLDADGNIDWSAEEKSVYLEGTREMNCGAAARLYRAVFPFDAKWQWTSSNPEIVSMDENGVVTALQNGEAGITLTLGDVSATCYVFVCTPVTSFELSRSEMYVVAKKTGRLSVVSAQPENHGDSFAWSSSNETYATVDQEGTVTGKAIGDATITVTTSDGVTRECLVHVCYPVTAVKFADETVNIHTGGRSS